MIKSSYATQVEAVIAGHPERYRAVPIVAADCGLRQGETFGIRVGDVDFLRRRLHVRQQVKLLGGRPVIAPPKGGKVREVPLPDAKFDVGEGSTHRRSRLANEALRRGAVTLGDLRRGREP